MPVLQPTRQNETRNFFTEDPLIQELIRTHLPPDFASWAEAELTEFGGVCAGVIDERARHTDREGQPRLVPYDRYGDEQSKVEVNEGYRQTAAYTYGKGIVGYVHKDIPALGRKGNYFYSFAQGYVLSQSEPGFYCPVTLTMATAYLLDRYGSTELKDRFLPHVLSTGDTELYEGATFLTERQGGSDVGANETRAVYENGSWRLYGEKYFASNAGTCGVATVLARPEGAPEGSKGLALFLVPWHREDGGLNSLKIRRLKDKLGVRAVPSGEVEFSGSEAYIIGEKDRGFYYMMEALNLSRICNAVASVGIMRRAYSEAKRYAEDRHAFGGPIIQYPMVQDSLVKMNVRLEAQTRAVFELVREFDEWYANPEAARDDGMLRLMIALVKAETADQAIHFSHEAIELHGGNGYIEDFVTPRLLRDAQVLTVWEGTANILGLEVLRLFGKFDTATAFLTRMQNELGELGKQADPIRYGLNRLSGELRDLADLEPAEQTRVIKPLQKKMIALYEALTLAKAGSSTALRIYADAFLRPLFGEKEGRWSLEDGQKVLQGR
ncbi:acyl-CoA dehydrogenase family protein [Alteribacter natronophilus]|uniref:acyl-CoA dehydrogenase family protein n=1 Tax=Alteribacter natronophilus TaxID=2583810 RepID=UPI00110E7923|nr:acyl-CoA dehydrogenase family protein [Alteribacter natronophilus]TMW70735.1 isovaleryl-CoA dehydrogenase [Alteribacter natronophilus]